LLLLHREGLLVGLRRRKEFAPLEPRSSWRRIETSSQSTKGASSLNVIDFLREGMERSEEKAKNCGFDDCSSISSWIDNMEEKERNEKKEAKQSDGSVRKRIV
jgi:hypothetical protein